jgi:hypothetical protein
MNLVTKHKKPAQELLAKYVEMKVTTSDFTGIMPLRDEKGTLFIAQFSRGELVGCVIVPGADYLAFIKQLLSTEPQVKQEMVSIKNA